MANRRCFSSTSNIATGDCRSIREVVLAIARQIGRPDLVRLGARPTPAGEPLRLATTASILRGLGFQPRFTLETGIADTIAWWAGRSTSVPSSYQDGVSTARPVQRSR